MLTETAQRRVQGGTTAPMRRLLIGGEDITDDLADTGTSISYAVSEGEAELTLAVHRNIDPLINSVARFYVGYGDETPQYFLGKLYDSDTAYSAFKLLADQSLPDDLDLRGYSLKAALYKLYDLAGFRDQEYEIRAGERHILAGDVSLFKKSVKIREAVSQLLENAGYVTADMPDGTTVVMPAPRPGSTSTPIRYDLDNIPLDDGKPVFTASPGAYAKNLYAAVRVYRDPSEAGGEGEEADAGVNVVVPVETETRRKPPKNRYYEISEFTGDEEAARNVAAQYARLLGRGTYACEMGPLPANPDVIPYSSVRAEVIEHELPLAGGQVSERYERAYNFTVDDSIELEVSREAGHAHSFSGEGLMVAEKHLPKPYYIRPRQRSGIVRGQLSPFGFDSTGRPYISDALPFVSYDEETLEAVIDVQGALEYGFSDAYFDDTTNEVVLVQ